MWHHFRQESHSTALCVVTTCFVHTEHGFFTGPGLICTSPDCWILYSDDSFINWYVTQLDISPYIHILDLWYFLFEGGLWLPSSRNPTWLPILKTLVKHLAKVIQIKPSHPLHLQHIVDTIAICYFCMSIYRVYFLKLYSR